MKFHNFFKAGKGSPGITLIETIIGVFILTMGIATVVGTTVYSYTTYARATHQITAVGLAREGLEVVRNIRDSNWKKPNVLGACGDPALDPAQQCYIDWERGWADTCMTSACQAIYGTSTQQWRIVPTTSFGLQKQPNGFYNGTTSSGSSSYYRKIKITNVGDDAPFSSQNPEYEMTVYVSWVGRGCADTYGGDPEAAPESCRIVLTDRFTNWKNY